MIIAIILIVIMKKDNNREQNCSTNMEGKDGKEEEEK